MGPFFCQKKGEGGEGGMDQDCAPNCGNWNIVLTGPVALNFGKQATSIGWL